MKRLPVFDPEKTRAHWPIISAYQDGKLSIKQAEAQLSDLGMMEWEVRLYLDKDCGDDDE